MSEVKWLLRCCAFTYISLIYLMTPPGGYFSRGDGGDDADKRYNEPIIWKPLPTTRGTYSIISSCLLVWGLCMWSAIHLNIPSKRSAKWQWVEKCEWLFWGMLYPEVITFLALQQNTLATELSQSIGDILKDPQRVSFTSSQ